MASSTACWCGSTVATIARPTESGTPRVRSASTSAGLLGAQSTRSRLGGWVVEHAAVFSDDAVEYIEARKGALEVGQFAPGHENRPSATGAEALDGLDGGGIDDAVVGDRAVVVGGEDEVSHVSSVAKTAPVPRTHEPTI